MLHPSEVTGGNSAVVDASVAVKWYVEEEGSADAQRLLDSTQTLLAPDHLLAETAHALTRYARRRVIEAEQVEVAMDHLISTLYLVSPVHLVREAADVALRCELTVYDSLYVALALATGATLCTADRRMIARIGASSLSVATQLVQSAGGAEAKP